MTEFMPLFAGSAGDQWPVPASLKKTRSDSVFAAVLDVFFV